MTYLIPFVIFGVGLIYGLIFFLISIVARIPETRAIFIFLLSFFSPFGFNWLKPELILINSYFSTNLYMYILFLLFIVLLIRLQKTYKLIALFLLFALPFWTIKNNYEIPKINVAIANLNLTQDKKWDRAFQEKIIEANFYLINEAVKNKNDLIILPESAFPTYLNVDYKILDRLKQLSQQITIFTGSLRLENDKVYNSSYLFDKGIVSTADKVVLVPFGEKIPFPKFINKIINDIFFNGADDYESAKEVQNFTIKGYKFRNAICFEATIDKLFVNNPKQMIAISNNAWFTPSIEPTLQNLLLKLYAKKHNTIIYHSANAGISEIIKP